MKNKKNKAQLEYNDDVQLPDEEILFELATSQLECTKSQHKASRRPMKKTQAWTCLPCGSKLLMDQHLSPVPFRQLSMGVRVSVLRTPDQAPRSILFQLLFYFFIPLVDKKNILIGCHVVSKREHMRSLMCESHKRLVVFLM